MTRRHKNRSACRTLSIFIAWFDLLACRSFSCFGESERVMPENGSPDCRPQIPAYQE